MPHILKILSNRQGSPIHSFHYFMPAHRTIFAPFLVVLSQAFSLARPAGIPVGILLHPGKFPKRRQAGMVL